MSLTIAGFLGRTVSLVGFAAVLVAAPQFANAQSWYQGSCGTGAACDCGVGTDLVPPDGYDPGTQTPDGTTTPSFDQSAAPSPQFSQQFGGGSDQFVTNFAPPSIGDSFSPAVKFNFGGVGPFLSGAAPLCVASPSSLLGRTKLVDNNSPLPRNRLIFDYNFFHDAALVPGGLGVSRFTPGFETTMFDGMASVEMRIPMAVTANSDLVTDANSVYQGDIENGEFGNLQFTFKALLLEGPLGAIAAGLAVTTPTGDDVTVSMVDGTPIIHMENESVHLMPYVALLRTFGPDIFTQFSLQLDIDANGNAVLVNQMTGNGMEPVTRLNDQNLIYFDATVGAWMWRDPSAPVVTGLAVSLEAHYTGSLEDAPTASLGGILVGAPGQDLNMVNLTCGCHVAMGRNIVTVGYGVPVTKDRVFEGEARVFVNRYY